MQQPQTGAITTPHLLISSGKPDYQHHTTKKVLLYDFLDDGNEPRACPVAEDDMFIAWTVPETTKEALALAKHLRLLGYFLSIEARVQERTDRKGSKP